MGIFDFFARKPKAPEGEGTSDASSAAAPRAPAAPPPNLTPWQERLWHAEHTPGFAWEDDNEQARMFVRTMLHQAAASFGNGPIVNGEPAELFSPPALVIERCGGGQGVRREDRNPELRGEWEGAPVRTAASIRGRRFWTFEMRCPEHVRFFSIHRDMERVPRAASHADPWAKSEQQTVFLGKGIFLDDSDPDTTRDWLIPQWASVPAAAQELVVREMERLDLRFFELSNSHQTLLVVSQRKFDQMEDPTLYLKECASLLSEVVKALAASSGTSPAITSAVAAAQRVTCKYCTSMFLLAVGKNTCPNCGAPAS